MTKKTMVWALGLMVLLPMAAEGQQDPEKIGEGAQVYAANCARCHNARSGTERTDAEWVPIVAHMRARGNLTKSQAEAVLAFLQATNLPEGGTPMAAMLGVPENTPLVVPAALSVALQRVRNLPERKPGSQK